LNQPCLTHDPGERSFPREDGLERRPRELQIRQKRTDTAAIKANAAVKRAVVAQGARQQALPTGARGS